jgi:signal transduction histidine kinase
MPASALRPLRAPGPFLRWPRASDAVLAAALLVLSAVLVDGPGGSVLLRSPAEIPAHYLLLCAVACGLLYWRRRLPLVVLAGTVTAWALTLGSDFSNLGGAVLVALYSAGRYAPDSRWGPVGVAAGVSVGLAEGALRSVPWGEAGFAAVVMTVAWYVGRRRQLRAERAEAAVRARAAEARRIVVEERTRIARELHDVVAHRVSLMTVQAGAAQAVAAQDLGAALRAMAAVEEAGRQALGELRDLLGVLRPDSEGDALGPQPGLADLPRLVDRVREAGLQVSCEADGLPAALPDRVDLFAYRIVQESLTNVLKHAGPGSHAQVRLGSERGGVVVEVLDDGPSAGDDRAEAVGGPGHGLVGMRERALLLGGRFDAGARPGGGFRVAAHLPLVGGSA